MSSTDEEARVLIYAPLGRDAPLLHAALTQAGLTSTVAENGTAFCRCLSQGVGALLLTEEALAPAVLESLRTVLLSQPEWSNVPVVLLADKEAQFHLRRLFADLLGPDQNLTVLERPVPVRTLSEIMYAILAGRRRQYQVRDLLNQLAVQNEQLRQAMSNREQGEERLYTLYQLSELATRAATLEQLFEATLHALEHLLSVERASILLVDDQGVMRFRAWHNLSHLYRQQVEGHSPWTGDEQEPQPVLISDVAEAEPSPLRAALHSEGIGALAFIPLLEEQQLFGNLMLYYNRPHRFLETEVQLAQTIARHLAHAIGRKQAEAALQQLNTELEQRVEERTAELARSNRELDQFAYVASHDLKAPLRAIRHLASWLLEDVGATLPPQSQQHLMKLMSRISRMDTLLDDLLAYSRVGRQRHNRERVDTALLVRNVVELLTVPPGFRVTLAREMPVVVTERVPLEIILRNLIGNAFKHHPDPRRGEVKIAAKVGAGVVEFSVTDNGNGIDPGFHSRIFELFQTLQPRDEVEGSGIGLAVVKKLVENQGGKVQVSSVVGEGATFAFTWPTSQARYDMVEQ